MNQLFKNGVIHFRNQINTENRKSVMLNIHCAGNKFFVKGENSLLSIAGEGYIRNSLCHIEGKNNTISIGNNSVLSGNCSIRIIGDNNVISVGDNCNITYSSIYIKGNNNSIVIGEKVTAVYTSFLLENNSNVLNVKDCTSIHGRVNGITEFVLDETTSITIEEDCMISNDVSFRSTDSHSVLNNKGERVNPAGNILVKRHVWIGMRSIILKNTIIHNNCVIGTGSICNRDYEKEKCLIAGNPARIIKESIDWSRDRL